MSVNENAVFTVSGEKKLTILQIITLTNLNPQETVGSFSWTWCREVKMCNPVQNAKQCQIQIISISKQQHHLQGPNECRQ